MIHYPKILGRFEYACKTSRRYPHANIQHPLAADGIVSSNTLASLDAQPLNFTAYFNLSVVGEYDPTFSFLRGFSAHPE